MACAIVPPYLLQHIASLEDPAFAAAAEAARYSLLVDHPWRGIRVGEEPPPHPLPHHTSVVLRELLDARRLVFDGEDTEELPGVHVWRDRVESGEDPAALEAWAGLGHTHDLFRYEFGRASLDDDNLELEATVHFGDSYDNAFWDGERIVFGEGDGVVFRRMTSSLSVIGHELSHGLTQYTAELRYRGQSGSLNEHISDVFGSLVEQRARRQSVEDASWLIGEGIFTDRVAGTALRSLKAPGSAYDDVVLGKDPQPWHMHGFVETEDDYGGVHLNSGIPNRAFYLVAAAFGGNAWEYAGQLWYDTITGDMVTRNSTFADFAAATLDAAAHRFGATSQSYDAVVEAWRTVGVT